MLMLLINHFSQLCKPKMSSSKGVLKCTVCGGDHSRLHWLVLCNSCSGDKRKCDCQSWPPPKKKRTTQPSRNAPSQSEDPEPNYEKLYSKLVEHHEQVADLEEKKSRNRRTTMPRNFLTLSKPNQI